MLRIVKDKDPRKGSAFGYGRAGHRSLTPSLGLHRCDGWAAERRAEALSCGGRGTPQQATKVSDSEIVNLSLFGKSTTITSINQHVRAHIPLYYTYNMYIKVWYTLYVTLLLILNIIYYWTELDKPRSKCTIQHAGTFRKVLARSRLASIWGWVRLPFFACENFSAPWSTMATSRRK